MPNSCDTPGDRLREHLLSTSHVGAHIHSALHHPQPTFCLHWKPFWSGFHVVQKCTNAEGPFPILPHSSAIHPHHFTAMGASGAAEVGLLFNALIINIWRDIFCHSVGRSSRPYDLVGFNWNSFGQIIILMISSEKVLKMAFDLKAVKCPRNITQERFRHGRVDYIAMFFSRIWE